MRELFDAIITYVYVAYFIMVNAPWDFFLMVIVPAVITFTIGNWWGRRRTLADIRRIADEQRRNEKTIP